MKRLFNLAIGALMLLLISGITTQVKAQVYGEFDTVRVVQSLYEPLAVPDGQNGVVELTRDEFGLPPNFNVADYDNGYARIDIGFEFEFNGEVYDKLWININGFVTFGKKENNVIQFPPFLPPTYQEGLFLDANAYPVNVIAPFWGDHYYRSLTDMNSRGFKPSKIYYKTDGDMLIVEWKDLNINYSYQGKDLKNSIGNFQVKLFKSQDPYSKQGDIEFHYGTVGGNPYLSDTDDERINTKGATIGIKGEGKIVGEDADYMNAFINDVYLFNNPSVPASAVSTSTITSNDWPPTTIKEAKFYFKGFKSFNIEEWWGDGDVDFSKAPNPKHPWGLAEQNRFVTVNDARLIMKSIATEIPLDPIRRRAAYHGDVNHNGRYYYDVNSVVQWIPTKSKHYADDLPSEVSSVKQILFYANEYDAALILSYMAVKIPELPWLLDTLVIKGKVSDMERMDVAVANIESLGNGLYRVPVYLNQDADAAVGVSVKFDAQIIAVDGNMMATHTSNKVFLAGADEYKSNEPVAYITLRTDSKYLTLSDITVNDVKQISKKYSLNNEEITSLSVATITNPVEKNNANFVVNVPVEGNYTLSVYDVLGNQIAIVANGNFGIGSHVINFDATSLNSGAYFFKFEGENGIATGKMIVK
ncbi:MAG: hypothetical protein A2X64_08000 [Ignavibacteria bacterium GWF2_33_9]|nr:MAG: hypothetical protein A2X64_08000 [Ignavibacteria bacterium GWF2_33_9]